MNANPLSRVLLIAGVISLVVLPSALAQGVLINDERASNGYRLIAPLNDTQVRLMNRSGETVHTWTSEYPTSTVVSLQPDGLLMRTTGIENPNIVAGGRAGRFELLDWDSNIVWSFEYNSEIQSTHHDVKRLPNGNYLFLVWHVKSRDEAIMAGADPTRVGPKGVFSEKLIEVRPNYPEGGEIVWEWNLWDHLVQNYDESLSNYGDPSKHPELLNLHYTANENNPDWWHANSVDYNPALDQIAISVRNVSEVWIIDHSTTSEEAATHSGGRSGKGGDFLYRWGNPSAWMSENAPPQMIDVQHNAHWIEPGLPGEGHMLIFSNNLPGVENKSLIAEIELPVQADGSYLLEDHMPYGPNAYVWTYASEEPGDFFSGFISGMQRLPNGNTMVCSGMQAQVFEVTPDGEVLWKYSDAPAGNPNFELIFRSYWYPENYPGLAGTPLYSEPVVQP